METFALVLIMMLLIRIFIGIIKLYAKLAERLINKAVQMPAIVIRPNLENTADIQKKIDSYKLLRDILLHTIIGI